MICSDEQFSDCDGMRMEGGSCIAVLDGPATAKQTVLVAGTVR